MIEIYHTTRDLGKVLREGLKAPYQLSLEGGSENPLSSEDVDKSTTPKITRFLHKAIFFFDESPVGEEWVSILADKDDASIKVGNINLVETPYRPGAMYEKSLMSFPDYLKRRNQPLQPDKPFENPFTASMMGWDQMSKFEKRWSTKLDQILRNRSMFEYSPEILVPRLVIEPPEFHRRSIDS